MIAITASCANHQTTKPPREVEITVDTLSSQTVKQIQEELESQGWVVQFNGDNMDTYCSKQCAQ